MRKILYAFRFLTIIPIPWKQDENLTEVARSTIFFPLIGLIIGGFLALLEFLLRDKLSPMATSGLILSMWVIVTGGLHLDGLSDVSDGLGGRSREESLRIMKDSNIGAFGAISLILILVLKLIFINEIITISNNNHLLYPLVLAPAWGRLMELIVIRLFKTGREGGMGSFFKNEMREREWIAPLVLTLSLTIYLLSIYSLLIILPLLLTTLTFATYLSRKFGGLTGDGYGAVCEISELLFLIIFSLARAFNLL